MKLNTILISALFILSSCGYSMRGSVNIPSSITSVSVISSEYSELVNILNSSLTSSNIETSISMGNDLYRIAILSEKFNGINNAYVNLSTSMNNF